MTENQRVARATPLRGVEYRGKLEGGSTNPALIGADDGQLYVVKGPLWPQPLWESLFWEFVVGRLAERLQTPVPPVEMIHLDPDDLVYLVARPHDLEGGLWAGSLFIEGLESPGADPGQIWYEHKNEERHARLAVLLGWVGAHDFELCYNRDCLVFSIDNEQCSPTSPLLPAEPHSQLKSALKPDAVRSAIADLRSLPSKAVEEIIFTPPQEWLSPEKRGKTLSVLLERLDAFHY